ncbi:unnamed protein product, partial [Polarella glacialis]
MDWVAVSPHSITDFSGPPTLLSAYIAVYSKAVFYAFAFLLSWCFFFWILKLCGWVPKTRGTWALKSFLLLHHMIVGPLALYGLWEDPAVQHLFSCFGCNEAASRMLRDPNFAPLAARA